ncbi:MAG: FAD-dependent oxidoreductase [Lentisphaerota bacterium]
MKISPTVEKKTDNSLFADVLVVGAGASGIPAAIAAARQGAKVMLLEEDMIPGGAPVDMFVGMLCGGPRTGIFLEMAQHLNASYNLTGIPAVNFADGGMDGRDYWYMPSSYLQVLREMMLAESNLKLTCGSPVTRALVSEEGNRRRVHGVVVDMPNGSSRTYTAPVTIDATGTGLLAALAGCEIQYGRNARSDFNEAYGPDKADSQVQPCTWMFISQRIRPDAVFPDEMLGKGLVESNYGWIQKDDAGVNKRNAGAYLHWGATVQCADTLDPVALAMAQDEALNKLNPMINLLRDHGYIVHLAPKLGVRECRRVMGESVVTATDLLAGRFPDDTIAHCEFFLDAWGEHDKLPRTPVSAGIPYGSLIPRGTEGLLMAGKAISGTHLAMSAYRVQPVMASVGTAAGVAGALAAGLRTGIRDIPLNSMRRLLCTQYGMPDVKYL